MYTKNINAFTVFTRVLVDLLQPKSRSEKSPSTYTWVKNWDWNVQDKLA